MTNCQELIKCLETATPEEMMQIQAYLPRPVTDYGKLDLSSFDPVAISEFLTKTISVLNLLVNVLNQLHIANSSGGLDRP